MFQIFEQILFQKTLFNNVVKGNFRGKQGQSVVNSTKTYSYFRKHIIIYIYKIIYIFINRYNQYWNIQYKFLENNCEVEQESNLQVMSSDTLLNQLNVMAKVNCALACADERKYARFPQKKENKKYFYVNLSRSNYIQFRTQVYN